VKSVFFSFDGLDGAGKTTQLNLFCEWLREAGRTVVSCVDPGGTALGDAIRQLLLGSKEVSIGLHAEMLLFMAARAQLVDEVIRPTLAAGNVVVSDRYLLANVVYQGHAGGLDVSALWHIGQLATGGVMPNLTFVLDMPPAAAAARIGRPLDRMERKGTDYRAKLREGYLQEAKRHPGEIVVIDAARTIDAVQDDIRRAAGRVLRG
jgi:dTMP kinase